MGSNVRQVQRPNSKITKYQIRTCGRQTETALKIVMARSKGKGKAGPLQAWSGLEGSRKLRFPDFMTMAQDGGKVVSFTHRLPLSQIHQVLISVRG
jgi:hypothetical protein